MNTSVRKRPVCLVTGASGGIGAAVVRDLLKRGSIVIAVDIITVSQGSPAGPGTVEWVQGDVCKHETWEMVETLCEERHYCLHKLATCAAVMLESDGGIETVKQSVWEKTFATNVLGTALAIKAFVTQNDNVGGSIVCISSIVAEVGSHQPQLAYTASKGAVVSLARECAVILASKGIRVNVVCPGITETPLTAKLRSGTVNRKAGIPLARWATPDDIAKSIEFLLFDNASYITGAVLTIDGGVTCTNPTTLRSFSPD